MKVIEGVIFDYGFTLSSDMYFKIEPEGVENWQAVLKEVVFDNPAIARPWMRGEIGLPEVASIVAGNLSVSSEELLDTMRRGCRQLRENPAVKQLALDLKALGVPIALVTANFDVFSDVVVSVHKYDELFDVIVNSSDHGCADKRQLWPIAFQGMDSAIGYHNTLLIEDGETEPALFRGLGGTAIEYTDDPQFIEQVGQFRFAPLGGTGVSLSTISRDPLPEGGS